MTRMVTGGWQGQDRAGKITSITKKTNTQIPLSMAVILSRIAMSIAFTIDDLRLETLWLQSHQPHFFLKVLYLPCGAKTGQVLAASGGTKQCVCALWGQ